MYLIQPLKIKIKEYFKIALILRLHKFVFANYSNTKELIVTIKYCKDKDY